MSVGVGSKSTLTYALETSFGVFPATPSGIAIALTSENIQNSRNTFLSKEVNPTRQVTSIRTGNSAASGDIDCQLSPNAWGEFLRYLLTCTETVSTITPTSWSTSLAVTRGAYYKTATNTYLCTQDGTTASTGSGPVTVDGSNELNGTAKFQYYGVIATSLYKHVIAAGTTKTTGGLCMERLAYLDSGSKYFSYIGGRLNTLSIKVPQEGFVTAKWGIVFVDLNVVGTSSLFGSSTLTEDEAFDGADAILYICPPGGSYTTDVTIDDFDLSITNNYDEKVYTMGSKQRADIPEGTREIKGSMGCYFEDITKFNDFINESVVSLRLGMAHSGEFMQIDIPQARLTGGTPSPVISGNGVLKQNFDFAAFNNTGTGSDITFTLYNSTAAYT